MTLFVTLKICLKKKVNNLKISSFQLIKYRCLLLSFIRCPDGILLTFVSADAFCLVCWLILSYCPQKMFSFLIRDVCGDKADSQKYSKDYGFVSLITTIKRGTFQIALSGLWIHDQMRSGVTFLQIIFGQLQKPKNYSKQMLC